MASRTTNSLTAACLLFAATCLGAAHGATMPDKDLVTIKERLRQKQLPGETDKSTARRAAGYMKSLGAGGTWKDIDYRSQVRSNWPASGHLGRLVHMSKAYRQPNGTLAGNAGLKAAILRALDHWLKKDYRNPNWWWNEIGVPMGLGKILLLMEEDLSAGQLAAGVRIMKRSKPGRTGQNMVWQAGNQVTWGCLAGDAKAVNVAFKCIAKEIRIAPGDLEGVKPDYSFWQHGKCFYSGGYGLGYSSDSASYAWLARGTRYAFSKGKIKIISDYLLEGQQWLVRGLTFDYGAEGRGISRPYTRRARALISPCKLMIEVDPQRRKQLAAFLDRLENGPAKCKVPLLGNRHFWKSDFMVHHRKQWYASARMFSTRIDNTDNPCNDEGLLNHHVADGVTYIMKRGDEYEKIFPVWNWRRIPGITAEQKKSRLTGTPRCRGRRGFVGGVSDGEYGLAAMDFLRGKLTAKKTWFFFDREFVALGAGISCSSGNPVLTSINQCHLKGDVLGAAGTLKKGTHKLTGPTWLHHDGVGYFFPQKCNLTLGADKQTGSWHLLRKASPKTRVELDVFSMAVDHGKKPQAAKYAYVVAPGLAAKDMPAYAKDPGLEIIKNTASLQAVRHKKLGITAAAFFKAGKFSAKDGLAISVDKPCLLLLRLKKEGVFVTLSNPHNKDLAVNLAVKLAGGKSFKRKINLPKGERAGSSATVRLR